MARAKAKAEAEAKKKAASDPRLAAAKEQAEAKAAQAQAAASAKAAELDAKHGLSDKAAAGQAAGEKKAAEAKKFADIKAHGKVAELFYEYDADMSGFLDGAFAFWCLPLRRALAPPYAAVSLLQRRRSSSSAARWALSSRRRRAARRWTRWRWTIHATARSRSRSESRRQANCAASRRARLSVARSRCCLSGRLVSQHWGWCARVIVQVRWLVEQRNGDKEEGQHRRPASRGSRQSLQRRARRWQPHGQAPRNRTITSRHHSIPRAVSERLLVVYRLRRLRPRRRRRSRPRRSTRRCSRWRAAPPPLPPR